MYEYAFEPKEFVGQLKYAGTLFGLAGEANRLATV